MYSPRNTQWRRGSYTNKYERVPLMEDQGDTDLHSLNGNVSINGDEPILQSKPPKPTDTAAPMRTMGDLIIIFLVLLLSETARGIVLPTLSPYVNLIGGNAVMLGYAVAAFSVGRFASTIGLGYLSTTLSYKKVLAGSVAICVVGNAMYALAVYAGPYFLLAARFICGFGAGTLSVIRAYVAHVTTPKERTKFMSILGAVQFFGFAIMPGAGSLLSFIPQFHIAGAIFDKFTLPGYVLAVGSLLLLFLIVFEFKNPPPLPEDGDKPTPKPATPAPPHPPSPLVHNAPAYHSPQLNPPPFYTHVPPHVPLHLSQHFSPVLHPHSPHSPSSAILLSPPYPIVPAPLSPHMNSPHMNSPLLTRSPFVRTPSQLREDEQLPIAPISPPAKKPEPAPALTDKQKFLIFGVFLTLNLMVRLVLGIIETIATPVYVELNGNKPGKDVEAGFVFGGLGLIGMGVLFFISFLSKHVEDMKILLAGLSTLVLGTGLLIGDITLARFITGCGFIWCIGYPLAQTIIVSMFSKMLGSKPQGTWMGWIGAMGSLGRIIGPVVAGWLLQHIGQSATMIFGTAVAIACLLTSLLLLLVHKKTPSG